MPDNCQACAMPLTRVEFFSEKNDFGKISGNFSGKISGPRKKWKKIQLVPRMVIRVRARDFMKCCGEQSRRSVLISPNSGAVFSRSSFFVIAPFRSVLKNRNGSNRSVPFLPFLPWDGTERNETLERKNRPFQIKIENFPI